MILTVLIAIIWIHFIADFLLQPDEMGIMKSKNNVVLGIHALVYSMPFVCVGIKYALFNCVAHFVVDWLSSRTTTYFFERKKRHWFFVTIGADQAVHMTVLFLSLNWFTAWKI